MRFSAVVLAAGSSSRMEGRHKLMLPLAGEPVVRRTVRAVLGADPVEVVVVTGFNGEAVAAALSGLPLRLVSNPSFAEGQMTSAVAGVAALAAPTDAVMMCLADMPLLESVDYRALVDAYCAMQETTILVPWRDGQRGNPVLFAAGYIPEVVAGTRNMGCRRLVADHPDEVLRYEPEHDRFFADLDTPGDYAAALERVGDSAHRPSALAS